ncbi:MAG: hypothetical protein AB8B63_12745 [Granulosicoccus sp.]
MLLLLCATSLPAATVVEIRETADYLAISFEAEDYDTADERWVLTDPTTSALDISMDPDPNHSEDAVGNAYLELLPDYRVTHSDSFVGPDGEVGFWGAGGAGPQASYSIDFPEAGRYYVHARALSTGTEDNGLHIGLNGEWPDSGQRHQFCSAGAGWSWSSRQRDTGETACGLNNTIWITVPEPGTHTFAISAREDGFELDRVMLIKDKSDNTRICKAEDENSISCRGGRLINADEVADVAVIMTSTVTELDYVDSVNVGIVVENVDGHDDAEDVTLEIDLGVGTLWELTSALPDGCELADTSINCSAGLLGTTSEDKDASFQFTLQPLRSGNLTASAVVSTSTEEEILSDNDAQIVFTVSDVGRLSELVSQINALTENWQAGEAGEVTAQVQNLGPAQAQDVTLSFILADGLTATTLPEGCSGLSTLICEIGELDTDATAERTLSVSAASAGMYSLSATANASNLDGEEPVASYIANVLAADNGDGDGDGSGPVGENENMTPVEVVEPQTDTPSPGSGSGSGSGSGAMGLWMLLLAGYLSYRLRAAGLRRTSHQ